MFHGDETTIERYLIDIPVIFPSLVNEGVLILKYELSTRVMTLYLRYIKSSGMGFPFTPLVIPLPDSICDGFASNVMVRVLKMAISQPNLEGDEVAKMEISV